MMNEKTINHDRTLRKKRLCMYLRYELRMKNYWKYALFTFLLPMTVLLGIMNGDMFIGHL